MAESEMLPMNIVPRNADQVAGREQRSRLLARGADQNEQSREWSNLFLRWIYNRETYNKTVCWKCKMWMLIVFIVAVLLITALIIIVIVSIRATSIDDESIDPRLKINGTPRYYVGSMKISRRSFTPELMMPQSKKFSSLSNTLKIMLRQLYNTSPALGYYFVDSDVFSFSNGSVIAYYWLQFALPKEHDLLVKYTLSIEVLINILQQHLHTAYVRRIMEVEPSSVTLQVANEQYVRSLKTGQCVFRILLLSTEQTFDSLRLVDCSKSSSNYWLVQGEGGYSIKATISTKPEGSIYSGMDVTTYSTWFPDPKQTVSKFSQIGQHFTSEVIVFGNTLLMALNPTPGCNLSQYSITFLQVPATECGGVLGGTNGSFILPKYSNDHHKDINCIWNLKLQEHFRAKVFFKDFKLGGSPNTGQSCITDYVEVDGQRFCGDHQYFCFYSKGSSLQIKFYSNQTHTKGFAVDYMATNDNLADAKCHQ